MKESVLLAPDGVLLRYRRSEPLHGRPWLLFVGAFGLDFAAADAFFERFAGDYNIATWECRLILSEQERQVVKEDFALRNHVQDLFCVADALGVSSPILVGYCSGAGIALAAVRQRPGYFKRLVLVHGEFTILKDESCVTQILKDIDAILPIAARGQDKAQFILERVTSRKAERAEGLPPHVDLNRPFGNSRSLHRYALNYVAYRDSDFEQLAAGIETRTLVMTGNADMHTNVSSARRIGTAIGTAEIFIDKDADHYGVVRPRSNTLQEIGRFLAAS